MSKEASLWFLAAVILIVVVVYVVARMIAVDARKRKYTGKLTAGRLFSANSGMLGSTFSSIEGLVVSEEGLVCFVQNHEGVKRSTIIKLGASSYFHSYGPSCKACIFTKVSTVNLYLGQELACFLELADCCVKDNCVMGFDSEGADCSLAFGSDLILVVENY